MKSKKYLIFFVVISYIGLIILLVPTIYPSSLNPDRGIFESVSYRLIAGDKLYEQVWDNKDPFFYYLNAIPLYFSPIADLGIEIIMFISISILTFLINKKFTDNYLSNFLTSFFLIPLVLIQFGYVAGYSHLPGILLTLLFINLLFNKSIKLAGVILGTTFFTKIIFVPISLILVLYFFRKDAKSLFKLLKYFSITLIIFLIVLFMRGELFGYLNSLYLNYFYATSNTNFMKNLINIFDTTDLFILILLAAYLILINTKLLKVKYEEKYLAILNILFGAGVLTLLFTGKYNHHIQILTPFIIIGLSFVLLNNFKSKNFSRSLITIFIIYLLISLNIFSLDINWRKFNWYYSNDLNTSPEANLLLAYKNTGEYARLGQNDDNAHAKNLGNWKLVCPRFHQYPFESSAILTQTLNCFKASDFLIISPTFKEYSGYDSWNKFVKVGNEYIDIYFQCENYENTRICSKQKGT